MMNLEETPIYDELKARESRILHVAQRIPSILAAVDWNEPLAIDVMYRHELPNGTVFYAHHDILSPY